MTKNRDIPEQKPDEKPQIDLKFEEIIPWNGQHDTGKDVRLKWSRNFERIKAALLFLMKNGGDSIVSADKKFWITQDGMLHHTDGVLLFDGSIIATKEVSAFGKGPDGGGGEPGGDTPVSIIIDTMLSETSENPVQNKVITLTIGDLSLLKTASRDNLVNAINDAMKGNHEHKNLEVLNKITNDNYDSWVKVVGDWARAFYFDDKGQLRARVNLIGDREVSAYGDGGSSSIGIITLVDNLESTSKDAALTANMGRELKRLIDEKNNDADLSGYATIKWVNEQGFLKYVPSGYATQKWVSQQGYLTKHQSLANYPTRSEAWLTTDFSISDYAKKSEAWLTTDFSISDYVTLDTSQTISGRKNFTSNVGIGVNSPTEKLDVGGNVKSENVYITSLSGNHTIYMGNQNGVGANKPSMIQASNGNIYMGYGTSWTGGGTFTKILTITNDGKVGIGTETPSERLAILGSMNLSNSTTGGYKQGGIVVIRNNGTETVVGANRGTIHFRPAGHNMATAAYIDVNGNFVAKGEVTAYSDARLKSNVKTLQNRGYIRPVSYIKDGKESIGFLAQDVRRLYPELVHEDNSIDRYLSFNYAQYTAVLQAQIIELSKRLDKLERHDNR